jgi:hypothetical protein
MIKSFWFVPMFDVACADWPAFEQDRINVIGKPSAFAGGKMYGNLRVSYHQAMVEEIYFYLLPLLWVITRILRRTEALKLSVKLLSGLTLIALVAVAIVGLSHSASAAADGKVYVTNKASGLTTEPSTAVVGRTSATTVYGTYASYASTGTTARDIVANSDRFVITVVDADLNTITQVSTQSYDPGSGLTAAGAKLQVVLNHKSGPDNNLLPIVGAASDFKIRLHGGANVANVSVFSIDYVGSASGSPVITLIKNYGGSAVEDLDIGYPTSAVETLTVSVKSIVDTGGTARVSLTETGLNTGRFEGEVLVSERTAALTAGVPGTGSDVTPAVIPTIAGPITVTYVDAVTSGTATNTKRTASYSIDIVPPTATITSPITASESQERLPTITGSTADVASGLDVSRFSLAVDNSDDAADATRIIVAGRSRSTELPVHNAVYTLPTVNSHIVSVSTVGYADGAKTFPFTYVESVALPTFSGTPNHIVDFQIQAADLAGNFGYSDSSATAGNDNLTGRHGNQPHTMKIDQVLPIISSAETGVEWDTSITTPAEKANVRDSVVVRFDGKVKESSISVADFSVTLSGTPATVIVPVGVVVHDAEVYLDLDVDIASANVPTVKIIGTVQDLAGNSTDSGSKKALDKLSPVLTVTTSGGSGTGTGTEAADSLTKDKMTITVVSDEDLQAAPSITVTDITSTGQFAHADDLGNVNSGTPGIAAGSNTWTLVIAKGTSADGARSVYVSATDSSGQSNAATDGKNVEPLAKVYTLDKTLVAPTSSPAGGGTTTQTNPFLTSDFKATGEVSTLTVTAATLDTVDVMADVIASADKLTFFYQPTTALTNIEHTYVLKTTDAAGNTLTTTTKFTKSDRTDFVLELFAGWNSVSFPSNPLDSAVNTVLSNSGIKQVVAYDATTPSQPWRIASKVGDEFTSQTTPALESITAGPGYWIETSNFEDQSVGLEGPTGPGDARPGLTTIATGNGWNLVGVVDQSRAMTQKVNKGNTLNRSNAAGADTPVTNGAYFNTVNNGRAYTFDTVTSKFREQVGADTVTIGSGIWVFISPQSNGQLPHIVP